MRHLSEQCVLWQPDAVYKGKSLLKFEIEAWALWQCVCLRRYKKISSITLLYYEMYGFAMEGTFQGMKFMQYFFFYRIESTDYGPNPSIYLFISLPLILTVFRTYCLYLFSLSLSSSCPFSLSSSSHLLLLSPLMYPLTLCLFCQSVFLLSFSFSAYNTEV